MNSESAALNAANLQRDDQPVKTVTVSQDTFPGAWLEPLWTRSDLIKMAPYYALRLMCGAKVTDNPRGRIDNTSIVLEGIEYVLFRENYEQVCELVTELIFTLLEREGYAPLGDPRFSDRLRYSPDLLLNLHKHAALLSERKWDVPAEKTRMLWIAPDLAACGHYRSLLPYRYLATTKTDFYAERTEVLSQSITGWYDAFIMHRCPRPQLLSTFQQLKSAGKVLVYEYDDDIFNVPDWNFNSQRITPDAIDRARISIDMADVIVASTEPLLEVCQRPEVALHGPNLIDFSQVGEPLKCDRELNERWKGYYPVHDSQGNVKELRHKQFAMREEFPDKTFQQVRILWAGSNTHDLDLQEIQPAVLEIGKKYGMAVSFIFFGFCPTDFTDVHVMPGNTKPKLMVKQKYRHFIQYIESVRVHEYFGMVRHIDADFALCPLADHPFNLSKSNLKLLEMGSLGIPCIASDFGPYQCLRESGAGILIHEHGKERWVEAIEHYLIDLTHRQYHSQSARSWVYNEFSWDTDSLNRRKWDEIFDVIHTKTLSRKSIQQQSVQEFLQNSSR